MYADSEYHLRDRFVSNDLYYPSSKAAARSYADYINRPLTPPPDMNGVSFSAKPSHYYQQHENELPNASSMTSAAPHHSSSSAASYTQHHHSSNGYDRHSAAPSDSHRQTYSPTPQPTMAVTEDVQSQPRQRTGSQASKSIAAPFRIPKTVNDSGGSLAELAAQITCLFWFESSDLLSQIEHSPTPLQPSRPLVSDARPTTGFRKWVTTILSTTMVAQNVVILALLFIYRLKKLNPSVQGKPGSEYRLLTVALMLGNKFLDDNTYTNRTWAEVSGINVSEVHIMEVEFLSNMKYCLFTTADDWTEWQSLLGRFAAFFERASKPLVAAPVLPPTSSLHLPMALPSPPSSNQASPPYLSDLGFNGSAYGSTALPNPSPALSPHVYVSNEPSSSQKSRKRSYDDQLVEPPAKRLAGGYPDYQTPQSYAATPVNPLQSIPRLPLPNTMLPNATPNSSNYSVSNRQLHQLLPPINVPTRAMSMVYPPATSTPAPLPQVQSLSGSSQPPSQMTSTHPSRQQSPYPTSAASASGSPSMNLPHPLHHHSNPASSAVQVSPTYYLQHRNSPYRPVQNVSTLLYPPPAAALQVQHRSGGGPALDADQMYYQPLGKPSSQRQTGRLPYVLQNMWLDGSYPESMTPVQQWPGFLNTQAQQQLQQQQSRQLAQQQ